MFDSPTSFTHQHRLKFTQPSLRLFVWFGFFYIFLLPISDSGSRLATNHEQPLPMFQRCPMWCKYSLFTFRVKRNHTIMQEKSHYAQGHRYILLYVQEKIDNCHYEKGGSRTNNQRIQSREHKHSGMTERFILNLLRH